MQYSIRPAEKRDIPQLISMLVQTASIHNLSRPDIFKTSVKKYDESKLELLLEDENTFIFVAADDNDTAIGYIICLLQIVTGHSVLRDNKTFFIDDLCTDEFHRSKGVGKALYEHAVAKAKELGCYNVTLNVWAKNENALKFYKNLGLHEQKLILEQIL